LVLAGERLLDRAVAALAAGGCAPLYAVVREGTQVPAVATRIVNPRPERGMRSSLDLAVANVEPTADALAVVLVDVPGVGADAVRTVCESWRAGRIAVGRFAGRRGHPTVMSLAMWRDALALAGPDEGARRLLTARHDLVDEVEVPGDAADLDTPADVATWRSAHGGDDG
jgi:molybdenum cofactor cytidylyltransferase/nicotine blue oxidoreductase